MMAWFTLLLTCLLVGRTGAKAVFAHFMIGNTGNYTTSDATDDIAKAQEAHIDAFALNIANGDPVNDISLPMFFDAAEERGFQLFFSFDYAGNGPWDMGDVTDLINNYAGRDSYYHYSGQPFVSTFEGPANSDDWLSIKQSTGCFFVPDWSSLGAKPAVALGTADGLFNWAAWPWGPQEMNTYVDASYIEYLDGLPYMMPASPWFYTNLPGYKKNWLWRGDDLWYDRWQEIWYLKPPFVEIISWNDYGESHYIGPLREHAMEAFDIGQAPYNYVIDMPHDGWRLFLPYLIDTYKYGTATIDKEGLTIWHRPQPVGACDDGGTSANTASQFQVEFEPASVVQDNIFFSALLGSPADIRVSVGGVSKEASWTWKPDGGIGIYHGSVPFGSSLGEVVVTLERDGTQIAQVRGSTISTDCVGGLANWNAWVGYTNADASVRATPKTSMFNQKCVNGTGVNNFAGLCEFACTYGYCPLGACYCQEQGEAVKAPNATGPMGYPLEGLDASYSGLCAYDCAHNYCPESACGTVSAPLTIPTVSDFLPPACIAGTGEGNLAGLCSFACNLGHCPISACTCTAQGALHTLPEATGDVGVAAPGMDETIYTDLCEFTCMYGYCPEGACLKVGSSSDGGQGDGNGDADQGTGSGDVYVDPDFFLVPSPVVECIPPCNIIFPEEILPTATIIYLYPVTTTLIFGGSSIKTTLHPSPITTSTIDYYNMPVYSGQKNPFTFYLKPSYTPTPIVVSDKDTTTTIILPPVSIESYPDGQSSTRTYPSLTTTHYITTGETYTYSEAQFPSLTRLPVPTVSTTTIPARNTDDDSDSTQTPVPIWIQSGGFYWSNVPDPTHGPGDIPSFPSFPPVPDPPCFRFGDLFSIHCPPDRSSPATTWSSHVPRHTCTDTNSPGCGHSCTTHCEDSSATTSTCTADTATNYWVSCSGTVCETTRSATFTGCSVTDSTTTAGDYCPTGITIDPDGDQGATPWATPTASHVSTTSIPEIAIIGGEPYTATRGSVVADGHTIKVPTLSGSNQVTTTIDGVSMVLIPSFAGTVTVAVLPTARCAAPEDTDPEVPAPDCDGNPARYHLFVVSEDEGGGDYSSEWHGLNCHGTGACRVCGVQPDWRQQTEVAGDVTNPDFPDSLDDLSVFGDTCSYSADQYAKRWTRPVGTLSCDRWKDAICIEGPDTVSACGDGVFAAYMMICEWPDDYYEHMDDEIDPFP